MGDHTRNSGAAILFFFGRRVDFLVPSGAPWPCESSAVLGLRRSALVRPLDPKNKAVFPIRSPQSVPHPVRTRSPDSAARAPQSQLPRPRLRPTPAALPDPSLACYSRLKFFFFFSNLLELSTPRPARSGPVSRHNSPRPTSLHRLRHLSEQYFPRSLRLPSAPNSPPFAP